MAPIFSSKNSFVENPLSTKNRCKKNVKFLNHNYKEWNIVYNRTVTELVRASRPVDGSECPPLGEEASSEMIRKLNDDHTLHFGTTFRQALKDSTAARIRQMEADKAARVASRTSAKEAKNERKIERKSRKKSKEMSRVEKARKMVEKRLEMAREEFERKQQELRRLEEAVQSNAGEMLLDFAPPVDDVIIEEFEFEEYEEEELDEEDERMCSFVGQNLEHLRNQATARLDQSLLVEVKRLSHMRFVRPSFERRMKSRFHSVLDFLLDNVCDNLEVRCRDFEIVFGEQRRTRRVQTLVDVSTQLVVELERQCRGANFVTNFLTLNGKTSQLM